MLLKLWEIEKEEHYYLIKHWKLVFSSVICQNFKSSRFISHFEGGFNKKRWEILKNDKFWDPNAEKKPTDLNNRVEYLHLGGY